MARERTVMKQNFRVISLRALRDCMGSCVPLLFIEFLLSWNSVGHWNSLANWLLFFVVVVCLFVFVCVFGQLGTCLGKVNTKLTFPRNAIVIGGGGEILPQNM